MAFSAAARIRSHLAAVHRGGSAAARRDRVAAMATPYESAQLILKLYELRRDPLMREARQWFVREFNPETIADVQAALASDHNPRLRMVAGYWDMACSLVAHGAIDRQMFIDASGEVFATFAKVQPLLAEIRQITNPAFAKHVEEVLMAEPGIDERLEMLRQRFRRMAAPATTPGFRT
jgi:hypothetical protein